LVRWQHHTLGLVGPGVFIDIAEQSGLIVPIGEWILATACAQLLAFQSDPAKRHLTIAVNLSARQLAQADIVDVIIRILTASGAPADRLKLEITESMLLNDIEATAEKIRALSEFGIRFALDDFGTGYSSLGYLKKLSLSQLKIDHSFVKGLLTEPVDAAIVRTIIQLAKSLKMSVISEGVELEGQRKVLAEMGCKEFQGYLFGKPAPLGLAP
jgi:EAL domain-containing protein (putative c-di-GMP-specific phosphodiesterase class I)